LYSLVDTDALKGQGGDDFKEINIHSISSLMQATNLHRNQISSLLDVWEKRMFETVTFD